MSAADLFCIQQTRRLNCVVRGGRATPHLEPKDLTAMGLVESWVAREAQWFFLFPRRNAEIGGNANEWSSFLGRSCKRFHGVLYWVIQSLASFHIQPLSFSACFFLKKNIFYIYIYILKPTEFSCSLCFVCQRYEVWRWPLLSPTGQKLILRTKDTRFAEDTAS